jgi:flagellar hook-basal body complex protein FliE
MEINSILSNALQGSSGLNKAKSSGDSFSNMVTDAVKKTVDSQRAAEKMTAAAANGQDVPMHKVIQSISEAEMTLQTMVTVRDKAVEAYKEIIRMPI